MTRTLAYLALLGGSVGCILFVDTSPTGDAFTTSCGIASGSTACGQCLTTNCQAALNTCCTTSTCASHLGDVDQCAAGNCSALENDFATAFRPVVDCAMGACASACAFTYASATQCAPLSGTPGLTCDCSIPNGTSPNGTSCGQPPSGFCCADVGWPAGTTSCRCIAPLCDTYANGCSCEATTTNDPSFFVSSCSSTHCCARTDGSCFCSTYACDTSGGEVDVGTTCTPADVTCSKPQEVRVPRCSAQ